MKLVQAKVEKKSPPYTKLRAQECVQLSKSEARKLLKEIKPHIAGHVVGEYPILEELARLVQVDLGLVS
jgi:hypothetical protein